MQSVETLNGHRKRTQKPFDHNLNTQEKKLHIKEVMDGKMKVIRLSLAVSAAHFNKINASVVNQ